MGDTKGLLRQMLKIVLDREPDARIDLFKAFPFIKRLFAERHLHATIRTIGDIVFVFVIFSGFFGPQDSHANIAIFLSWGLWWPSMILSWFFVGRMWCGFCSFPGIGRIVQRLGWVHYIRIPRFVSKYGIYWAVGLFSLIIWLEESTGIKESPRATALLILSIISGATICAVLFPLQAWCRYLCPMGRMTGAASTLAITEFRPNHEICRTCKHFACKRGRDGHKGCPVYLGAVGVKNNLDCLVCGHCVALCDKNSPQLNLRSPFSELILNKGRFITCSFIIHFLMGSQLARFLLEGAMGGYFSDATGLTVKMIAFSVLLLAGFFFVLGAIRLGAIVFGITEDEMFGRFSPMVPVFLPMAFAGELILRLNYTVMHAPEFLPSIGQQFGIDLMRMHFIVPLWWYVFMDIGILLTSVMASLYVLSRFVEEDFQGLVSRFRYFICSLLVLVMGGIYAMLLPIWY